MVLLSAVVSYCLSLSSAERSCHVYAVSHLRVLLASVIRCCLSLSLIVFHQVHLSSFSSLPLHGTIRRCHLLLSVVIFHFLPPSAVVKISFFAIARHALRLSFAVISRYLSLSSTKCSCQVFLLCKARLAAVIHSSQLSSLIVFHQVQLSNLSSLPLQGAPRGCHSLLSFHCLSLSSTKYICHVYLVCCCKEPPSTVSFIHVNLQQEDVINRQDSLLRNFLNGILA